MPKTLAGYGHQKSLLENKLREDFYEKFIDLYRSVTNLPEQHLAGVIVMKAIDRALGENKNPTTFIQCLVEEFAKASWILTSSV